MKKLLLFCGFIIVSGVFLMAQDIDAMVKNAVDGIALRVTTPIEANIGGIYLEGTVTSSALSRYLANRIKVHAHDSGKFNLSPFSHSNVAFRPGGPQKGIIKGSFRQTGEMVTITLQLVGDPGGQVIESRNFTISESYLKENGIDVLPANVRSLEEIVEQERIFAPPALQQTASTLQIEVWPDSDTGTYFAGDKMTINLFANRDCYARVDYVDASGNWQLLFPNRNNRDNFVRANQLQTLPRTPVELIPALGMERIWVRVSTEPFNISESEFTDVKAATRDTVTASRAASGRAGETAEAFFSITKLPDTFYDETFSYSKPDSMAEEIQAILVELQQGDIFSGTDLEGSYTIGGTTGVYHVTGDTVTVSLRYNNQLFPPATRATFSFSFEKPGNMTLALQSAKSGFKEKGGDLEGDVNQGNFKAKTILGSLAGRYTVIDRVNVVISEKPFGVSEKYIQEEVEKHFKGF